MQYTVDGMPAACQVSEPTAPCGQAMITRFRPARFAW